MELVFADTDEDERQPRGQPGAWVEIRVGAPGSSLSCSVAFTILHPAG